MEQLGRTNEASIPISVNASQLLCKNRFSGILLISDTDTSSLEGLSFQGLMLSKSERKLLLCMYGLMGHSK